MAGGGPVGSPIAEVDLPRIDDVLTFDHVHAFVVGDGGVHVGGDEPHPVAHRDVGSALGGAKGRVLVRAVDKGLSVSLVNGM